MVRRESSPICKNLLTKYLGYPKMKIMKKYSLLFLLAITVSLANAQDKVLPGEITSAHESNYKNWAIGGSLGLLYMAGDHSSFDPDSEPMFSFNPALGLHATRYLNSAFGIRFDLNLPIGPLKGSNGLQTWETTSYFDYAFSAVGNLSALGVRGRRFDRKSSLLVIGGFGMSHSKSEVTQTDGTVVNWPSDGTTLEAFLNTGAVLKYQLNTTWDLDLGISARFYMGDAVDGFTGTRATNKSDMMFYPHVGVSYNFGNDKTEEASVIYTNPLDDIFADVEQIRDGFDKLSTDDDKDGVNNYFDQDPNTPEGVVVDGSGKAVDSDMDGIADYMDEDPFTSKGARVDANGRAIDSDGDGVADHMDKEPNTPKGTLVNFKGMSVASTGNGGSGVGGYLPSVYFGFNSATVTAANQERLATIAITMKKNPNLKVTITGNADSRGTEEYNKNLSMRRAQAVVKQLVQVYGIDESRLTAEGAGADTPLAKGNYSINRRADVNVK